MAAAEKQILASYEKYIRSLPDLGLPLSSAEKNDNKNKSEFVKLLASNQDLHYFPSTLWQIYALNGEPNSKRLAEEYSKAFNSSLFPTELLNGELIHNSFLTPFEITGDRKYYTLAMESLSDYISYSEEAAMYDISSENARNNSLELLLENQLLFFASRMTGDPIFRDRALMQSDKVLKEIFHSRNSPELLFGILNWENMPVLSEIEQLSSSDLYSLTLCMYGSTILFNEKGSDRYYNSIERIAKIFSEVYAESPEAGKSNSAFVKRRIKEKIGLLSRIMLCLSFANLPEDSDLVKYDICESIFLSVMESLETESISNNPQYSFRMYFYLMEYVKQLQQNTGMIRKIAVNELRHHPLSDEQFSDEEQVK